MYFPLLETECEAIQSPVSGVLSIENTTFGMMATYRCLEGYTLIGSRTRVCKAGTSVWTGSGPVCTIKGKNSTAAKLRLAI